MELSKLSPLCTNREICMGSSTKEVIKAYAGTLESTDPESESLIAGTVYGGLLFTFENNKLVYLFLGEAHRLQLKYHLFHLGHPNLFRKDYRQ